MAKFKPNDFILRCYGSRSRDGSYIGICLELNVAVQADSIKELKLKMSDAIDSYINTVLDTDDRESIPALMSRRAPMQDWLIYYIIRAVVFVRELRDRFTFKEHIPFHLAHNC